MLRTEVKKNCMRQSCRNVLNFLEDAGWERCQLLSRLSSLQNLLEYLLGRNDFGIENFTRPHLFCSSILHLLSEVYIPLISRSTNKENRIKIFRSLQ